MKLLALLVTLTVTVLPGQSWTNLDGASLTANAYSNGLGTITPSLGTIWSSTVVRVGSKFKGRIAGLDPKDEAHVGAGARVTVEGTPRAVWLEAGCSALVRNTAPLVPGAGGGSVSYWVRVHLPGGGIATVAPSTAQLFTP